MFFNLINNTHDVHAQKNVTKTSSIEIKILGINDFHGQISTGRFIKDKPVGGAAVLAAYLKNAQTGMDHRNIITIAGDHVGASTPASSLLNDEPTILFTNSLGNHYCSPQNRDNALCNIVATVGNHEFDKGKAAMMNLIYGTNAPPTDYWIPLDTYPGAAYPYVSANIVDTQTHKLLFPPYTIKWVDGIQIAFIGAVLKNAADSIFPAHIRGIEFLDEVESINKYIPEMKTKGADVIVVLIHEGGFQAPYEGPTQSNSTVDGPINQIIYGLDDDIDLVMAAHTHQFLNAYLLNHNQVPILVTQARSYSESFAEVTLNIDVLSHQVIKKSARIIPLFAQSGPGTQPDAQAEELVNLAENKVADLVNKYIGTVTHALLLKQNSDGESNLGNLITDAFRVEMNTDFGLANPHGLRNDINPGIITWGDLYSVMPFSNHVVTVSLSGQDIYDLLEQQWMGSYINMLHVSGMNYTYDSLKPIGHKIIEIKIKDEPLIKEQLYSIATTDFLASGTGVFSVMKRAQIIHLSGTDHDTVMHYIKSLHQPFSVDIEGRMKNVNQTTSRQENHGR